MSEHVQPPDGAPAPQPVTSQPPGSGDGLARALRGAAVLVNNTVRPGNNPKPKPEDS